MNKNSLAMTLATVVTLCAPVTFAGEAECLEEVARIRNSEIMACYLTYGPKSDEFRVQNQEPIRSCLEQAKKQYKVGVYDKCNFAGGRRLNVDLGTFSY